MSSHVCRTIVAFMQNYVTSEISLASNLISTQNAHLDVSGMNIRSLSGCRRFSHLQSLSCNNCAIANLEQILKLRCLNDLTHASFQGCPITHDPLYRASVIKWLPQLRHLDGIRISSRERQQAAQRRCLRCQKHTRSFECRRNQQGSWAGTRWTTGRKY